LRVTSRGLGDVYKRQVLISFGKVMVFNGMSYGLLRVEESHPSGRS
jgi:hypothetical protein